MKKEVTLDDLRETLEEMRIQGEISDRIMEDAKRRYNEATARRAEKLARYRAEIERENRPLLVKLRDALFGERGSPPSATAAR